MLSPNEIEYLNGLKSLTKEGKQALFEADQTRDTPTGKECDNTFPPSKNGIPRRVLELCDLYFGDDGELN